MSVSDELRKKRDELLKKTINEFLEIPELIRALYIICYLKDNVKSSDLEIRVKIKEFLQKPNGYLEFLEHLLIFLKNL